MKDSQPLYSQTNRFLGARSRLQRGGFCLLGVPLDLTVSYRPGTRQDRRRSGRLRMCSRNLVCIRSRISKRYHFLTSAI